MSLQAQSNLPSEAVLPDAPSVAIRNSSGNKATDTNPTLDSRPDAVAPEELGLTWTTAQVSGEDRRDQTPLSVRDKFQIFVANSYSSSTISAMALSAQTPNILSSADEQRRSFSKRYAAAYADTQSNAFFEDFLIPTLTHQDPVYHREALGTTGERVKYAMTRVFIARKDNGGNTFNSSSVAGAFVASAVHNAYHPYDNTSADGTINRALGRLVTRVGMNVVREFWPDVRQHFHGRIGAMMQAYKP
jgi:hypothetical protein